MFDVSETENSTSINQTSEPREKTTMTNVHAEYEPVISSRNLKNLGLVVGVILSIFTICGTILGGVFYIENSIRTNILGPINEQFNTINERFNTTDERFNTIDERFNTIDERFNTIEKQFDGINERLDSIDNRLNIHDRRLQSIEEYLRDN